jgi:hypothetical protein
MKKIFTIVTVLALGALLTFAIGCKKSSNTTTSTTTTTGTPPPPAASMAASYTAGIYSGTAAAFTQSLTAVNQGGGSQYGIQGSVISGGTPLTIYMVANITGTGTVSLGYGPTSNYAQFYAGPVTSTATPVYATGYPTSNPGSGVLNITSFSTSSRLISGTFSFTAGTATQSAPTTTVTTGSFSNVGF